MAWLGAVLHVAQYIFCDGTVFLLGFCSRNEEVLTDYHFLYPQSVVRQCLDIQE